MSRQLFSPVYVLPLFLVSPYLFVGPYGITWAELLIVVAFFAVAMPALVNGSFAMPRFLLVYLTLFTLGWAGAVLNAFNWDIAVGLWSLNFFYKVMLALGGYYLGLRAYSGMDEVVRRRFFKIVISALAVVAALYPVLTYDQRVAMLGIFYSGGEDELYRLNHERFPGLGINANIYSFMVFTFLLFSFDAYLRKLVPMIFPFLAFVVIFVAASKLVIGLSLLACLAVSINRGLMFKQGGRNAARTFVASKRALSVIAFSVAFLAVSFVFFTQTSSGRDIVGTVATFQRLSNVMDNDEGESALDVRLRLWAQGLERVSYAPMLGAPRHRGAVDESNPFSFAHPHNEFIAHWMFYGVAGMLAHAFLLAALIAVNLRSEAGRVWSVFYAALVGHMLFDGAFEYVRFYGMFFMLVGVNMGYLKLRQPARLRDRIPQGRALEA